MHALHACNKASELIEVVDGFVVTLKLFKLVKHWLSSYLQENICEYLSGIVYSVHNVIAAVCALKTLEQSYFTSNELDNPDIQRCLVTFQKVKVSYLYSCQFTLNLPFLQLLVARRSSLKGLLGRLLEVASSILIYRQHLVMILKLIFQLFVGNDLKA